MYGLLFWYDVRLSVKLYFSKSYMNIRTIEKTWYLAYQVFSILCKQAMTGLEVALRPPPVADKGSIALSEITSKKKCIYAQRIATIFQTGGHYPPVSKDRKFMLHTIFINVKSVSSSLVYRYKKIPVHNGQGFLH